MKELKITPIKNGTVIDHINAGASMKVLKILGLPREGSASVISVAINVPSKTDAMKDIVKIEDRELDKSEVDKITLVAPRAVINIIRNYEVAEKRPVQLPDVVRGIVRCENQNCISNAKEPVESLFYVVSKNPLRLKCHYCEREISDVSAHII